MLAKIWKKVLFAICIIACLFNVISKIVSRNSLEINLKSVNDGNTIWDSVKDKNETSSSDKIEGVMDSSSNTVNKVKTNIVNEDLVENEIDSDEEDDDNINNHSNYTIIMDE